MKKLGCLLTLALLWAGGQGVYEALRYRTPQSLTCAQAQTAQLTSWVHLTGCRVNALEAAYKTRFGVPTGEVFVPLRSSSRRESDAVRIVLATKDPEIVGIVTEMAALDQKDTQALFSFLAKNARRLVREKDVSGMLQSGVAKDDKILRRLRETNKKLVEDFVVIEEGRAPSPLTSILILGAGILSLIVLGALASAGTKKQAA